MDRAEAPECCVESLSALFDSLEEAQRVGTLKLTSPDGERTVYIYFNRGVIQYAKTSQYSTLLGRALVKRRKLTETQLKAALHRQREAPRSMRLGQILVESGLVTRDDIQQALAFQMAEEIFSCFTWEGFTDVFYRGEPPLDIFDEEDREFRVALRPGQLGHEARRRNREMRTVRKLIPSYHDVCVITTDSQLLGDGSGERELIGFLDGRRDVQEYLEALPAPDFVGLRILARLLSNGHAARLDGDQLVTLGQELEDSGDFRRARKRYLRATEIGHSDFELSRRLGQIEEGLENHAEAVRHYVSYAEQCERHDFHDVAVETLRHALTLDDEVVEPRRALAHLLEKSERTDEAVDAWRDLIECFDEQTDRAEVLDAWIQLARLSEEDIEVRQRLAELYLEQDDRTAAFMELQEVATLFLADGDLESAVPVLRKAHELDADEIMVHESLATTLARLGQTEEAVTEFLELAGNLERSDNGGIFRQHLTTIYEKVVDLDPDHGQARAWLASAYEDKKNSDKALANYQGMLPRLRSDGDSGKLIEVLAKIHELAPKDTAIAREYAELLSSKGRTSEGVQVLAQLADAAATEGETERATQTYKAVLAIEPGHLAAHRALAKAEADDPESATRRLRAVATLFELAERADEAREALLQAVEFSPEHAELRVELGRLLLSQERHKEALKHWIKAAKLHRDRKDRGSSRRLVDLILSHDKDHKDALQLKKELEAQAQALQVQRESQPAAPEKPQPKPMPTITGGGKAQVQVIGGTRKLSSINRLRSMLNRGYDEDENVASEASTRRASKGINRLKALRGGAMGSDSAGDGPLSSGPEGPGQVLDEGVAKKAAKGINKLKALRGGGDGGDSEGLGAGPVSAGPEGPGQVIKKKAGKGINKLKALRGGAGGPSGSGGGPVSAGPEGPGQVLDEGVAKKAAKGINKLKALRGGLPSGDGGAPASGGPISSGPEGPGQVIKKKAAKGINKLKALRGGSPDGGASGGPVSAGPEGPGQVLDEGVARKAAKGINRLKALKQAGGGPLSSGPEAPAEPVDEGISEKASKGISKLKALKMGGGAPATGGVNKLKAMRGGGPGGISKGPEAPGEAISEGLSKKANKGINKLKSLKLGKQSPSS